MAAKEQDPAPMDKEGGDGGGNGPDRQMQGLHRDPVLLQEADHQEDGADGQEDVLAEEEADIVGAGGEGPHLLGLT
jgi:hypothetical protein